MNYIKGKLKKLIFYSKESGFVVALFRVRETNVASIGSNKTITVTGSFLDPSIDIPMTLYGDYKKNDKWGMQFVVDNYEIEKPTTVDAIIDFLASPFVEGCGEVTAKKIVDAFGDKAIEIIKSDKNKLLEIDGITEKRKEKIYASLINSSLCPPISMLIPSSRSSLNFSVSSGFCSLASVIYTSAPALFKYLAADIPLLEKPSTRTFLSVNFKLGHNDFILYNSSV